MEAKYIFIILGVTAVVVIAMGIFVYRLKIKEKQKPIPKKIDILDLLEIVKNKESTLDMIEWAVGVLESELSVAKDDGRSHLEFIYFLASHKNSNSKLIIKCDKILKTANPNLTKSIESYEKRGLDDRK